MGYYDWDSSQSSMIFKTLCSLQQVWINFSEKFEFVHKYSPLLGFELRILPRSALKADTLPIELFRLGNIFFLSFQISTWVSRIWFCCCLPCPAFVSVMSIAKLLLMVDHFRPFSCYLSILIRCVCYALLQFSAAQSSPLDQSLILKEKIVVQCKCFTNISCDLISIHCH